MPGEDIQSWSPTAATNATADTSINWAEGQPRASVNNSARSMMAATAKDRNLKNGSIVTGGTANAQTFTSGVGYTSVPTGLWVRLKIGLSNTGPTTLNMDGIGAVAIKDMSGNDLATGALVATGQYADFIYNGTNWIFLEGNVPPLALQCGRLEYVGVTALSFKPYNGNLLKINGVVYPIPGAGITGLGGPTFFINGIAAQPLAAATTYLVSAFMNGSVVTGNLVSAGTHGPSALAGNFGTEIVSGNDTLTLIGLVRTNGSAQFQMDNANAMVISWFNRRNISIRGNSTAGAGTASGTAVVINNAANIVLCTWLEEAVALSVEGCSSSNVANANSASNIGVDGTAVLIQGVIGNCGPVGGFASNSGTIYAPLAEGAHTITPMGYVPGAGSTSSFYMACNAMIRG